MSMIIMKSIFIVILFTQADQLTADLTTERSNSQKIDTERSMLDRQNKELQAKLSEAEAHLKTRTKAAMQALESKIANLEEQLDAEARSVQSMASPSNCIISLIHFLARWHKNSFLVWRSG